MQRFVEQWYPLGGSIMMVLLFHYYVMPNYDCEIRQHASDILSLSSTLASVFLSFVGAIIGVVVSISDSSLMRVLKNTQSDTLLKQYIRGSFYSSMLTLLITVALLFILPNDMEKIGWYWADPLVFFLAFMILSSARIIVILFEIADINNSGNDTDNRWGEKPYSPNKV